MCCKGAQHLLCSSQSPAAAPSRHPPTTEHRGCKPRRCNKATLRTSPTELPRGSMHICATGAGGPQTTDHNITLNTLPTTLCDRDYHHHRHDHPSSHLTLFYLILSHRTSFYLILPYLGLSYFILLYLSLSYFILSHLIFL